MDIKEHTFLISGGGSGLGAATGHALVAAGGNVVIADLDQEAGRQVAGQIGQQALFVETDVTSTDSVASTIAAAIDTFGTLHGAINCAGIAIAEKTIGQSGPHDLDRFAQVVQVNLTGTFNVIRLAAASMAHNEPNAGGERGILVNTASVAAFEGQVGQAAYAASKGGIVGLTLPVARDLARDGIRVMTIAPGIFDTPMLAGLPQKARQSLGQQVPFPSRLGQPDEYAALVVHIIGNEMLNGEVIRLDGAIRMAPR
jgi:NAD(P)-dependent dehydrogenase (short-subunit alcohol dehydrogenase family)